MKTLLKGGSVVTGSGVKRADVLLEGRRSSRWNAGWPAPTRWSM